MAVLRPDPGPVTSGQFARNLAESGLFDLADLMPDAEAGDRLDGAVYARKLVDAGKLTGYQADAVLARRFADLRIGNYEILDRLGAGGMGTVYKARHRRMKRVVALKVLSKEVAGSGKFADRFQREVETIARLTHPNIVMAFDADEGEAGPFLVMEFVNGRDLASEVEKAGPLSAADAVDRIFQAARGLEYAHTQGIVHRDIKPGNILRDADGVVKVADLGLARLNAADGGPSGNTSLTQAGTVFGTVDYMSPEQAIDSGAVDQRADVYSLGCTFHFLLTGRPPYRAGSIMATMLKHRDDPIPDLRAVRPDVPAGLDGVFRRMVAKDPADRYRTMGDVAEALEPWRTTGPADGPPTGFPAAPSAVSDRTDVHLPGVAARPSSDTGHFELGPAADTAAPATTIVLVEPSRTQAGIIRRYLQQLGRDDVRVTSAGTDALEWARTGRAGLIVSSMHLSDMTGVQLARVVTEDPACRGIGFILATSESDTDVPEGIPVHPRVTVMAKPFDTGRLAAAIATVSG